MTLWDRYIVVTKNDKTSFITTHEFEKTDRAEFKIATIAKDFGYEESEIDDVTDDPDKMTLGQVIDILEGEIENANYHSLSSLPSNLSKRLLKTQDEVTVRTLIIALADELDGLI